MDLRSPAVRQALAFAGVLGGVLYVTGDLIFYGQVTSGADFHSVVAMARRSDALLVAGGVVAPFASAGYILGTLGLSHRMSARYPRLANVVFASWTGMFLIGIAYHAVYATRGFAAKLAEPDAAQATLLRVGVLLSTLYAGEAALGALGTLALAVALLRGGTGYPRWLALLMPTCWALADGIPRVVPAPVGGLLAGAWINGWFIVFFAAALVFGKEPPSAARSMRDPAPATA